MARGNFLLNTVAGRLGGMVLYRAKGEQRSRTYVATISNPKTRAQLDQRTQLANLVSSYRALKNVMASAFENIAANQSQYNAFVSANLNKGTLVYITKEYASAGACIAAPYQVTKGSLSPITLTGYAPNAVTSVSVGALTTLVGKTVAEFSAALVNANAGISYGMQLSYYSLIQKADINTGVEYCQLIPYEMTLDSEDGSLVSERFPARAMGIVDGYLAHVADAVLGGYCWVWSRNDSGLIKVSSQRLNITSTAVLAQFTSGSASTRAGGSYGIGASVFLSPATRGAVLPVDHNPSVVGYVSALGEEVRGAVENKAAVSLAASIVTGNNLDAVVSVKMFTSTATANSTDAEVLAGAVGVVASDRTNTGMTLAGLGSAIYKRVAIIFDDVIVWNAAVAQPIDPTA